MRKLRCIGGPLDGQWIETPEGLRQGDLHAVRCARPGQVSSSYLDYGSVETLENVAHFDKFIYRLEVFHFWKEPDISLLVDPAMTAYAAIAHAVSEWKIAAGDNGMGTALEFERQRGNERLRASRRQVIQAMRQTQSEEQFLRLNKILTAIEAEIADSVKPTRRFTPGLYRPFPE